MSEPLNCANSTIKKAWVGYSGQYPVVIGDVETAGLSLATAGRDLRIRMELGEANGMLALLDGGGPGFVWLETCIVGNGESIPHRDRTKMATIHMAGRKLFVGPGECAVFTDKMREVFCFDVAPGVYRVTVVKGGDSSVDADNEPSPWEYVMLFGTAAVGVTAAWIVDAGHATAVFAMFLTYVALRAVKVRKDGIGSDIVRTIRAQRLHTPDYTIYVAQAEGGVSKAANSEGRSL